MNYWRPWRRWSRWIPLGTYGYHVSNTLRGGNFIILGKINYRTGDIKFKRKRITHIPSSHVGSGLNFDEQLKILTKEGVK